MSDSTEQEKAEAVTPSPNPKELEKLEEAKLHAKYPNAMNPPRNGPSLLVQKRLKTSQKYFDSGDYQMARQRTGLQHMLNRFPATANATGETIPTPETVPVRKASIIQSKFSSNSNT